jgi:hypothetical protein
MKFSKKWLFLPLALVLVLGIIFLGGCTGQQGAQGEQGPAGTCDEAALQKMVDDAVKNLDVSDLNIDVTAKCCTAELEFVSLDMDCPEPGDSWFMVFGSGFPAEERVTLYFLDDGDPQLKWFRTDTNESGAFAWCGPLPSYANFDEDLFKDVSPWDPDLLEDCPCGGHDMWVFTVGAYVGNNLQATSPMYVQGD